LCGDASTRWSPSVAVYFPLSLFKIFDFEQAVSDLHLFLLYDSSWQAWLLLIAAFVLLVVGGTNRISSIPPQLQFASPPLVIYDCLSLSPHRFVVGFQLLLVFREYNTTKAKINLYLNPLPQM
jgi:hypothetical protein